MQTFLGERNRGSVVGRLTWGVVLRGRINPRWGKKPQIEPKTNTPKGLYICQRWVAPIVCEATQGMFAFTAGLRPGLEYVAPVGAFET